MRAKTYLRLGRVTDLPTVWTNVVAAAVLSEGPLTARVLVPLLFACSCFYVGGMFLTDAFDQNREPQLISPTEVFAVGFSLLGVGIGMAVLSAVLAGNGVFMPLVSGATLGAVSVAYDIWHRNAPASRALLAAWRALIYVTVAFVVAGELPFRTAIGAASMFAYVIGVTAVARHDNDDPLPWPLVLLFVPFVPTIALVHDIAGIVVWLGFLLWTAKQLALIVEKQAARAYAPLVAGISLVDATHIANSGRPYLGMLMAIGFVTTLVMRRFLSDAAPTEDHHPTRDESPRDLPWS